MRVFKRTYRDKATGQLMRTPKFYVEFRDHHDEYKRFPATVDEKSTRNVGFFLERLVALRLANALPSGEVMDWLSGLPPTWIERLADLDLVSRDFMVNYDSLSKHLADYEAWHREQHHDPKHIATTLNMISKVVASAGAKFWSHLKPHGVKMAIERICEKNELSPRTYNAYLVAMRSFCNWMVDNLRAKESPVKGLGMIYVAPKEHRRAFELDESIRLIAAATTGNAWKGISGIERAVLYSVILQTGFRAGEAKRLNVCNFTIDGDHPCVKLPGKRGTKHPKDVTLPIQPVTAAILRGLFTGKTPSDPAFNMPDNTETADMVRSDLETARRKWINEGATLDEREKRANTDFLRSENRDGQRVDFQALRVTAGTTLSLLDIPPAIIAKVMGPGWVSTVKVSPSDIAKALQRLPYLDNPNLLPPDATGV